MEGLRIRRATERDERRIADLIHGDPGQEAVAIAGCAEAARAFGIGLMRLPNSSYGWQGSFVAELDGKMAGVMQAGDSAGDIRLSPRMVLLALRVFGVGIVSVLPRARGRLRVDPKPPAGAYHIAELDVDPTLRNQGIGGALLEYAEAEAQAGARSAMSLCTTTVNPARRLYERHGYRIIETRTDPAYERYTGIAGRHLMVKELS